MTLRERVWEDFAADLEYHPKRGVLYLCLAAASFAIWLGSPQELRTLRFVLLFGCAALVLKGLYLLRKSSEGLALTQQELESLSAPSNRKKLPLIPILSARVLQDFGVGPLLLGPALHTSINANGGRDGANFSCSPAQSVAVGEIIRHISGTPAESGKTAAGLNGESDRARPFVR